MQADNVQSPGVFTSGSADPDSFKNHSGLIYLIPENRILAGRLLPSGNQDRIGLGGVFNVMGTSFFRRS